MLRMVRVPTGFQNISQTTTCIRVGVNIANLFGFRGSLQGLFLGTRRATGTDFERFQAFYPVGIISEISHFWARINVHFLLGENA